MAASAHVKWIGDLESGEGKFETGTGLAGSYSAASRFADGAGSNPEELIAAAHASCFSMALSLAAGEAGHKPESVETDADVYIRKAGDGFEIHRIDLRTTVAIPGAEESEIQKLAEAAKGGCPVSKALAGVGEVNLEVTAAS